MSARTITPAELAGQMYGRAEGHSSSNGAKKIRKAARAVYGTRRRRWHLTPAQVAEIKKRL